MADNSPKQAVIENEMVEDALNEVKIVVDGEEFVENTAEERKLLWKIDLWLMPAIWFLYLFSYLDRTNLGNASVAGLNKDLNLSDNQYYLAVVLFQIGYVAGAVPSNMILSRTRPSLYIPFLMFLWGTVAASLAAVNTPTQLLAIRFVLGIVEAGFSPAVLFLISTWYRKHEQSKRFIIFLSAGIMSGAFGGILAGAIASGLDGARGIVGWRWLFLVEGVLTVGISFIAPFILFDYPATTKKLTPNQRHLAFTRLRADGITSRQEGTDHSIGHWAAFLAAILNWRVWLLMIAYMTIISALSLSYFYPTLVKGLGYSAINAQFMTAPLYVVALVIAIPTCILADRIPNYRALICGTVLTLGAIFCALGAGIYDYVARYTFLCFINSAIWTANPLALSFASVSLGKVDPETRAISLALINGCGNLAQLYGSALFPSADAPKYLKGFSVYAGSLFAGATLYTTAFFLLKKYPFKSRI